MPAPMPLTWTNQRVSLTRDMIFGVCVLTEGDHWMPVSQLDKPDLKTVIDAVDWNSSCPFLDDLRKISERK